MDKALKRYRISFMMLGICVGIYLGGGVNLMLKGESLWGGVQAGTAVILFILFAFASDIKSLIKSTYSRIKSKISKK